MKIQDILFLVVLIILLMLKKPKAAAAAGLACLMLSIPLFYTWTFFTAERLVLYAAAFFIVSIVYTSMRL